MVVGPYGYLRLDIALDSYFWNLEPSQSRFSSQVKYISISDVRSWQSFGAKFANEKSQIT